MLLSPLSLLLRLLLGVPAARYFAFCCAGRTATSAMLSKLSPSVLQSFPSSSVQAMVPVTARYLRLFTQASILLFSNYPELSSLVITFYSHLPLKTSLLLKTTVAAVTASSPKIPSEQSLSCTMPEELAGEPPTYICLWVGQPVHSSHYP